MKRGRRDGWQKSESFISCVFSVDESDGSPLLGIAGLTDLIRVLPAHPRTQEREVGSHSSRLRSGSSTAKMVKRKELVRSA